MFCAILTLFIPVASKGDMWFLFAIRVFQGLAAGVTYPCLPPMIMRLVDKKTQIKSYKKGETFYNLIHIVNYLYTNSQPTFFFQMGTG